MIGFRTSDLANIHASFYATSFCPDSPCHRGLAKSLSCCWRWRSGCHLALAVLLFVEKFLVAELWHDMQEEEY